MNNKKEILTQEQIQGMVASGLLTKADRVGVYTFVCVIEQMQVGKMIHQFNFLDLPADIAILFENRRMGDEFGPYKIEAIYDVWEKYPVAV